MIQRKDLQVAGFVNKPHGISGEMSVSFEPGAPTPVAGSCLIVEMEGLLTPFFVKAARPRGNADTWLIRLEGVDQDTKAKSFNGKTVYMRKADFAMADSEDDADDEAQEGFYADDFIGYTAKIDGKPAGTITAIDDRTANYLFIIAPDNGDDVLLIPVVDEFISDIDTRGRTIDFSLPEGLV